MEISTSHPALQVLLGSIGLCGSLWLMWNGVFLFYAPAEWFEHIYRGFVRRLPGSEQGVVASAQRLNARAVGLVLGIGGLVLTWPMVAVIVDFRELLSKATMDVGTSTQHQSLRAPLFGVLALLLGVLMLVRPEIISRVQLKLALRGFEIPEERLRLMRLPTRVVGMAVIAIGLYVIWMWL